jgi:phosphohistidine phosphatase SixA
MPDNRIVSEDYVDGIFYVAQVDDGYKIQIETTNQALFKANQTRTTFDIDPTGNSDLDLPAGLYWIDYYFMNTPGSVFTLPVLITRYKTKAINTVNFLKHMDAEHEGFILIFRHTEATIGDDIIDSPLPEWWKSCDQNVARQLDDNGKKSALSIGNAIKRLKIPVTSAISSEFCRAVQTIEFMDLGVSVKTDPRLNHENKNESDPIYEKVFDVIKENPQENGVQIFVGHFNMLKSNPYRDFIRPFGMADGFLMRRHSNEELEFIGSIPFYLWELFE